jgi:polyferredoxin
MSASSVKLLLADGVLLVHFGIVLFVVGGLMLIVAGNLAGWAWVNRWGFRLAHLAAIGIVAAQSWLGMHCPLTVLESWLRSQAGDTPYSRSFIEIWVQRLLYYEAPTWVFTAAYSLFALLVVLAWWRYPPRPRPRPHNPGRGR